MRKLASIQIIKDIQPIPNKDRIGLATILGWKVIVNKADFKVGEPCVYFEVDSLLDKENPAFAFMEKHKHRVRTMKLAGCISQGLAMPLKQLGVKGKEGDDLTEVLKIKKYEPYVEYHTPVIRTKKERFINKLNGYYQRFTPRFIKVGVNFIIHELIGIPQFTGRGFPEEIAKTDETRVQSIPEVLDRIVDKVISVTEKVDGKSSTFLLRIRKRKGLLKLLSRIKIVKPISYQYLVCSRNFVAQPGSDYDLISRKLDMKNKLIFMADKYSSIADLNFVCIQGELAGPKIQGNKYKLKEDQLFVFNIIVSDGIVYKYDNWGVFNWCKILGLTSVPMLEEKQAEHYSVDDIVKYATRKSTLRDGWAEGVVIRISKFRTSGVHTFTSDLVDESLRFDTVDESFKVINPEFLLEFKL